MKYFPGFHLNISLQSPPHPQRCSKWSKLTQYPDEFCLHKYRHRTKAGGRDEGIIAAHYNWGANIMYIQQALVNTPVEGELKGRQYKMFLLI